ncbi:uncharacterized protein LOC110695086 [Chenopodium quinoa]|uniref:uncharacterized protein LOC110695086 n=1 Tax=Chenopodium quinoa TaxID=63459 RepID=UPI000B79531A|nr:uncharacterized protein LOC110695086 [Chenopodium quinoa]
MVTCIFSSSNVILCKIVEPNAEIKYVAFVYGAPSLEDRNLVWLDLSFIIQNYPKCLLLGDFNQLEFLEDKLGGNTSIRGVDDFIDWRFSNEVIDVPFSGPRFTGTNNRLGSDLILERLDRGYDTPDWFEEFPNGRIVHEPIQVSDHAAILYDTDPNVILSTRPYQLELWCLGFPEVKSIIDTEWKREISTELHALGENVSSLNDARTYLDLVNSFIPKCKLEFHYWRQRMKCDWIKEGDIPSKRLFNKVKSRKTKNEIITLRREDNLWVEGHFHVSNLIVNSLKDVFNPVIDPAQEDHIDLLLRQIHFPSLSPSQSDTLSLPFSDAEIREAIFDLKGSNSPGPDGCIFEFFQSNWDTVGYTVTKSVQHFFPRVFFFRN